MYKTVKYITTFICILILFNGCRQPVIPTEEDLAGYGWVLYEQGEYQEAREWFYDAVDKDSSYADGFNGIGWCFGKLRQADSAAIYFHISQEKPFAPYETPDLDLDLYAGLTFSYSGMHLDSLVELYGTYVIVERQDLFIEPYYGWSFKHEPTINHLDIHLEIALAKFTQGDFEGCRYHLQEINNSQYYQNKGNANQALTMNVDTILGRAELAQILQTMQQTLKSI